MPQFNVFEIDNYINKNLLPQFILFMGEDMFSQEYGTKKLFSKLNVSLPEMNFNIFEGRPELRELKNAMETLPMMSENRTVWLQKADIFIDQYISLFEQQYPESNYLILSAYNKLRTENKIYKIIKKIGLVFECSPPDEYQSIKLIIKLANEKGFFINNSAAKTVFEMCGGEMKTAARELEKLFYVCTSKIDKQDVLKYVTPSLEQNVFKIQDYLCTGEYKKAIEILDGIEDDKDKLGILSLLGSNLKRMLVGRACIDSKTAQKVIPSIIADEVGGSSWTATKILPYCYKYNKESLRYALKKMSEIDFYLKQGIPVDLNAALIEIYSNRA